MPLRQLPLVYPDAAMLKQPPSAKVGRGGELDFILAIFYPFLLTAKTIGSSVADLRHLRGSGHLFRCRRAGLTEGNAAGKGDAPYEPHRALSPIPFHRWRAGTTYWPAWHPNRVLPAQKP